MYCPRFGIILIDMAVTPSAAAAAAEGHIIKLFDIW